MTSRKKSPTIRDIAKMANVSYQTVSLVINGKPGVSDQTRKRILRLVDQVDYRPNRAAQMLNTHRSHTLELMVIDMQYGGCLADSAKSMLRAARLAGYGLIMSDTTCADLPDAFESARARLIDGILLYAPRLTISDGDLLALFDGVPLVRRDYVPGSKLAWVGFDQVYATRLALEHLIGLGHRHIAAIPPSADLLNGRARYLTWQSVLREHGLDPLLSVEGDYSISSAYIAARQIIASADPFTAILIGSDNMAIGVLRALHEAGLRVPQDVSIISFDNAEHAAYLLPALTTVDFRFAKQDELAVKYLLEIIADPQMEQHQRVLLPDLIVRESTAPPPETSP